MSVIKSEASTPHVPDFVAKLYRMLQDPLATPSVHWASTGTSFIVTDPALFAKNVLPRHFRHRNFASFVRQLNKYDFHKVKRPKHEDASTASAFQTGDLLVQEEHGVEAWEFQHPCFLYGREELLVDIKVSIRYSMLFSFDI